ncbi:hypothetical protein C8J56DRAFT_1030190 [Mycena floridula]|nr:hypothetical protein C8J56DRAFT_1030190 [Mycena floridula]
MDRSKDDNKAKTVDPEMMSKQENQRENDDTEDLQMERTTKRMKKPNRREEWKERSGEVGESTRNSQEKLRCNNGVLLPLIRQLSFCTKKRGVRGFVGGRGDELSVGARNSTRLAVAAVLHDALEVYFACCRCNVSAGALPEMLEIQDDRKSQRLQHPIGMFRYSWALWFYKILAAAVPRRSMKCNIIQFG